MGEEPRCPAPLVCVPPPPPGWDPGVWVSLTPPTRWKLPGQVANGDVVMPGPKGVEEDPGVQVDPQGGGGTNDRLRSGPPPPPRRAGPIPWQRGRAGPGQRLKPPPPPAPPLAARRPRHQEPTGTPRSGPRTPPGTAASLRPLTGSVPANFYRESSGTPDTPPLAAGTPAPSRDPPTPPSRDTGAEPGPPLQALGLIRDTVPRHPGRHREPGAHPGHRHPAGTPTQDAGTDPGHLPGTPSPAPGTGTPPRAPTLTRDPHPGHRH
ncbi:basic salivary proline-rich protein 1-like [Haliaeetus albicilla]|uniref:basic salivary proline-rich protein 1-like n=1 Tax=Haliaeetus albicilla TaxID=8969 RepID=UPI0037E9007C